MVQGLAIKLEQTVERLQLMREKVILLSICWLFFHLQREKKFVFGG